MAIAVLPNLPGFMHQATGWAMLPDGAQGFFDRVYTYAWFVGLFVAIGLYYILARSVVRPATGDDAERGTA